MSIADLLATEYAALNDTDAFNALRTRTITVDGMAQSGEVLAYIASIGKLSALETIAADTAHPLRDAAKATLATLNTREGFNFALPAVQSMLNAFVTAALFTAEEAATIRALGNKIVPEFEGITPDTIAELREPGYTSGTISSEYLATHKNRSLDVIVTISAQPRIETRAMIEISHDNGTLWRPTGVILASITSVGTYVRRVPGELIREGSKLRAVCPHTVALAFTVEVV